MTRARCAVALLVLTAATAVSAADAGDVDLAIDKLLNQPARAEAVRELAQLCEDPNLPDADRLKALRYLGLGYVFVGQREAATQAFIDLLGEDGSFTIDSLAVKGYPATGPTVSCFGQAIVAVEAAPATYSRQIDRAFLLLADNNDADTAITEMERLLDSDYTPPDEMERARRLLALGYSAKGREQEAVDMFRQLVKDDRQFGFDQITLPNHEEPESQTIRYLGEALIRVRKQEYEDLKQQLQRTSSTGAILRSLVLPGWGQLYRGNKRRGYLLMGLSAAAVGNAVMEEGAYRDARDAYRTAGADADFDRLYLEYSDSSSQADVSLTLVAAVWTYNVIDAALQDASVPRPDVSLRPQPDSGGVQVAWVRRF